MLILVYLRIFQVPNLPKFKVQCLKLPQMTFLDRLNSPNFILRKILVAVKRSNFNKVEPFLHILKVSGAQCTHFIL